MTGRFFTADYVERATLRDGTRVVLRLVTPDDKTLLRDGFERLSDASRYSRFLSPKLALSDDELAYLTEIDQENHFALGAIHEDAGIGLGVARFIRLAEDPTVAEAAVAVADEMHGRGLGKLLFLRLCAAASERGIERFRCDVLGSNRHMAALLAQISVDRKIEVGEGVMSIDLGLPDVAPDQPWNAPVPQNPVYGLLRAAAQNAVEFTESVRNLWRR
ncbi:MAG TPA: GNAT family N-acetyltransferase [Kofleriaceae bacterium]|nr:GNAT family N-acetyltransferase [Kofleriaceae bacterium]